MERISNDCLTSAGTEGTLYFHDQNPKFQVFLVSFHAENYSDQRDSVKSQGYITAVLLLHCSISLC